MDTIYHRHNRRKYSLKVHKIVAMETDKDHVHILLGYDRFRL